MTTLIIRYDADLVGMLAADAAEHGYDGDAVLAAYFERVERLARAEFNFIDNIVVDHSQAHYSGATRRSEVAHSDGAEMSDAERYTLDDIQRRALEQAFELTV